MPPYINVDYPVKKGSWDLVIQQSCLCCPIVDCKQFNSLLFLAHLSIHTHEVNTMCEQVACVENHDSPK